MLISEDRYEKLMMVKPCNGTYSQNYEEKTLCNIPIKTKMFINSIYVGSLVYFQKYKKYIEFAYSYFSGMLASSFSCHFEWIDLVQQITPAYLDEPKKPFYQILSWCRYIKLICICMMKNFLFIKPYNVNKCM